MFPPLYKMFQQSNVLYHLKCLEENYQLLPVHSLGMHVSTLSLSYKPIKTPELVKRQVVYQFLIRLQEVSTLLEVESILKRVMGDEYLTGSFKSSFGKKI